MSAPAPQMVETTPVLGGACASTNVFLYVEAAPYRCSAHRMQLMWFPKQGVARFTSPDMQVNPTDGRIHIHPGDVLSVDGHQFQVYVREGMGGIFPELLAVDTPHIITPAA